MKKIILITLLSMNYCLNAQYTQIPDTCFEQHLIDLGIDSDGIINGQVLTADINSITSLTMIGGNYNQCAISSLQGIDDFIALETLDISRNGVQYIDVSNLPNLKNLYCGDNFTQTLALPPSIEILYAELNLYNQNIDFSQTINIKEIHLDGFYITNLSHITEINVSNCPNLRELTASFNDLINLNTSNNPLLEKLIIYEDQDITLTTFTHNNPQLKTLTLTGNLTFLDISEMVNLEWFQFLENNVPYIDLTNNIKLEDVRIAGDDTLTQIDIRNHHNDIITLFGTGNTPNLTCVFVDDAAYSQANWTNVDTVGFVETEAECEALVINETTVENELIVYPNPVKNTLNIKITNTEIKEIIIYSILGEEIIKTQNKKIDLSSFSDGIYIIKIKTNNNKIMSKRIIKMGGNNG